MKKLLTSAVLAATLMGTAACDHMTPQAQRALSGGAIGAAGGLAVGALAGGSLIGGALIGSAAGATIGALTH